MFIRNILSGAMSAAFLCGCSSSEPTPVTPAQPVTKPAVSTAPVTPIREKPLPETVPPGGRPLGPKVVKTPPPSPRSVTPSPAMLGRRTSPGEQLPKADESSNLTYTHPTAGTLDIDGVCKISEDDVNCWGPDGSKNGDLEQKVKTHFDTQQAAYETYPIRYGMKNRLVVAKITRIVQEGQSPSLSVEQLGDSSRGGYSSFNLSDGFQAMQVGKPETRYESRVGAFEKGQSETSLRVRLTEPVPATAEIKPAAGQSVTLGNYKVTIVSIKAGHPPQPMGYMAPEQKAWTLKVRVDGPKEKPIWISLFPMAKDNMGGVMVDKNGKLATHEMVEKDRLAMEARFRTGANGIYRNNFFSAQIMGTSGARYGVVEMVANFDPKQVATLRVSGTNTKTIEVKGIPLDPK